MMTREEIDRHVAGILRLRKKRRNRQYERGYGTASDFDPHSRRDYGNSVDLVFAARQRAGWLPRNGVRD